MSTQGTVRVPIPTPFGVFDVRGFELPSGNVYLALVMGEVGDGTEVLVRLHSECLTGDALGSLRCDCGLQLRVALREIGAEGRGVLVYATGHEGRGIGLMNKLRAYMVQVQGADTVDANVALGLPVDARRYDDAAWVLEQLGVRTARLMTNNPLKVEGLRSAGIGVATVIALPTAPHSRNLGYLKAKQRRLGHVQPTGVAIGELNSHPTGPVLDSTAMLGEVRPRSNRPYVVLKYAQSLDGRIATATGDAKWISGEPERRVSHALRAACDAVLVGIGTVLLDDPRLTVRMVDGASPMRVVLDASLRVPAGANVLDPEAATTVITTERSAPERRDDLRRLGIRVLRVGAGPDGVDLAAGLAALHATGTDSVLVEGGATVITSLLRAGLVDRVIVAVAPIVLGCGTEGVGGLGVTCVSDGIRLVDRSIHPIGDDVVLAWDVAAGGS